MTTVASQITSLTVVYSIVYSASDQRKHQSSASLAIVRGIHRDRWIPRTKGQLRGKYFHLMTSSCLQALSNVPALHISQSMATIGQFINVYIFTVYMLVFPDHITKYWLNIYEREFHVPVLDKFNDSNKDKSPFIIV